MTTATGCGFSSASYNTQNWSVKQITVIWELSSHPLISINLIIYIYKILVAFLHKKNKYNKINSDTILIFLSLLSFFFHPPPKPREALLTLFEFQQENAECEKNENPNSGGNEANVNIWIAELPASL